MKIQNLFERDIFRSINGVVKADQTGAEFADIVWQELDEFVVTRELDGHFRKFFTTYCDAIKNPNDMEVAGKIGIWVSGFFGSGKSHFIKVLSYLLRNSTHTHDGVSKQAVEFFESKIKDAMLFGDIKRAVASHTDVILFNIDSKADHRSGRDAILAVFLKVLNEMQGSPSVIGAPEVPRSVLHAVYNALIAAADFYGLRNEHQTGLDFPDALSLYRAYEQDLHRFDQLYRHFCEAADQAEAKGWNILKPLRDEIEACYANWFLPTLGVAWGKFVDPKRVVYVYHNTVDAVGESTEEKTFEGVRTAINELAALVTYIVNNLNGNHIIVTADHGFLFTESPPGEPEKSKLEQKPGGTVRAKKRYLIGHNLPEHEAAWHGKTSVTAEAEGDMEFWIPRSVNRFHFAGGAKFVHGGAMLQEIVVPVITVRHKKDKGTRGDTKVKSVTVHVLGTTHKITTNRHRFELIQTEPVSERVKPVTLKVAVYDGDQPVTNVEAVTFESSSDTMDERKKWVHLVLQEQAYDKKTAYRLVLRDAETGVDQQSVPVVIDRAFSDDF